MRVLVQVARSRFDLSNELDAARDELDTARTKDVDSQAQIVKLSDELSAVREELSATQAELAATREELAATRKEVATVRAASGLLRSTDARQLREQNAALLARLDAVLAENAILRQGRPPSQLSPAQQLIKLTCARLARDLAKQRRHLQAANTSRPFSLSRRLRRTCAACESTGTSARCRLRLRTRCPSRRR